MYAVLKLQEAFQTYYEVRKNAPAWRDEHNQSLVDELVAEGKAVNSSAEQIRARMKREKNVIELGKAARTIRQRDNKHAVLKAVVTNAEGVDEELKNSTPRLRWSQPWLHRIAKGNRNASVHLPWNLYL